MPATQAQRAEWARQAEWQRTNRPASVGGVDRIEFVPTSTDCCTCTGCDESDPALPEVRPARLHDLYTDAEWATFALGLRLASRSVTRLAPCCFILCMLPTAYLPLICGCVYQKYANRRYESAIQSVLAKENARLASCGLRWWIALPDRPWTGGSGTYKFDLIWEDGARQQWEAAHPGRRRLSAEPYPFGLLPQRTQAAIADMARTRLATIGPAAAMADARPAPTAGYPFGFDMTVLDYYPPGMPPDFDGDAAARVTMPVQATGTGTVPSATVVHVAAAPVPVVAYPVEGMEESLPLPPAYSSDPKLV